MDAISAATHKFPYVLTIFTRLTHDFSRESATSLFNHKLPVYEVCQKAPLTDILMPAVPEVYFQHTSGHRLCAYKSYEESPPFDHLFNKMNRPKFPDGSINVFSGTLLREEREVLSYESPGGLSFYERLAGFCFNSKYKYTTRRVRIFYGTHKSNSLLSIRPLTYPHMGKNR